MKTRLLKTTVYALIVFFSLVLLFLSGPRVTEDETIKTINIPEDMEQYLRESESRIEGLTPGTEKKIIWADSIKKQMTPISLVYLHGFSATRKETEPLCDTVAKQLKANLFYTRLTGHGLDGNALAEATVNNWLNDAVEALKIGRRLGNKVVIAGTSTGGTLATWLAAKDGTEDIAALILLSPNFGLKNKSSKVLLLPWAEYIAPIIAGPVQSVNPVNPRHGMYWTKNYPTKALMPMMGLVDLVRKADLKMITIPVFVVYSPEDNIVDSKETEKTLSLFGSKDITVFRVKHTQDSGNHILAGDILAPKNTERIAKPMIQFLMRISP